MKRLTLTSLALTLACLSAASAQAAAEIWNLRNAVLGNGTTVTGSFAFDPTTGLYTNINIQAGSLAFGIPDPFSTGNATTLIAVPGASIDYTGSPWLAMNWAAPLTAAGGMLDINTAGFSFLGSCTTPTCNAKPAAAVTFLSGSVTTAETWTLQNAVLSDGTAVTGSFDFDPISGIYTNISIQAGGVAFGIPDPSSPGNATGLVAVSGASTDYTGAPLLGLEWATPLAATGGTVGLNTAGYSFLGSCTTPACSGTAGVSARFVSGSVTTVPEPGSWALLLTGLAMLAFTARRRLASVPG